MTWAASDIALVITTATTALTAIYGVVYPIYVARAATAEKKRDKLERLFFDPIMYCLDHVDEVADINRDRRIERAFASVGKTVFGVSKERIGILNEFRKNTRRIDLLSARYSIDCRELILYLTQITIIDYKYIVDQSGKLLPFDDQHEASKTLERISIVDNIIKKSRVLMEDVENISIR
jgi:hypothetical protein